MTAAVTLLSQAKKSKKKARRPEDVDIDAGGYSLDLMNDEFAFLLVGSKAVVIREKADAPVDQRIRFLTLEAFRQWSLNLFTEAWDPEAKDVKKMSWAKRWLGDRQRRQYDGVEFHPDRNPDPSQAGGTPGYYNLWRGWSCVPKRGGSYATFRDHLLNNICNGNEEIYRWVFAFFAHILQRPRERMGVSIVLRGGEGSGKTKIGEVIGSLIPSHYFLIDSPRYLTGQFNAHMASCLLLQADEAVWAGDKHAEGRLKGLISAGEQMIESKGVDPIRLKNYVRVLMTSNEDFVVPVGKDGRRYCVLDVNPRVAQNSAYFAELDAELRNGGREALLHDLLAFDLSTVDLRKVPRTDALLEQKILSLDGVDGWWLDRLMSGSPTSKLDHWPHEVGVDEMRDDYFAASERRGLRRKSAETVLGARLRKLIPRLNRVRRYEDYDMGRRRVWFYALPTLSECRAAFEKALGQAVSWQDDEDKPELSDCDD
ncbi:primase-helicase family protein [Methylobacterium gnaphalii]|uniref:NrS-1 polymerase-like helicase domain-containing protein n=1 Tax=Methylobacterium gnaphalii TaxID=1010610 RepID=A0A512JIQ8_9HYPH|nr:primase-helicase family protein [Methylobacterium gnaphalii]GEP09845.1 hypothetical protein MGN01_16900 [Methylobacterium gnaphalii]GJD67240.1 hypothetical protein MMMDOFMJ_0154 [Methylobacterium gnaphalii]GLS49874.1 hypothetical protein GCM10007885_27260 [Methylobacterium gnaphalii]